MTVIELLNELRRLDVVVWVDGDRLRVNAPKGALTPELQAALSGRKAEIIALLTTQAAPAQQPLVRAPRTQAMPVSFAQSRLWFLHQMDSGAYQIFVNLELGRVDRDALRRSADELVRRHEILRTTFAVVGGEPRQIVHEPRPAAFRELDLRGLDPNKQEAELHQAARAEVRQPFDLSTGPLIRFVLVHSGDDDCRLFIVQHHIVTDGWSLALLLRELNALYGAFSEGRPSPLPDPAVQYADYAVWQREWLGSDVLRRELGYWGERLKGIPALPLPTDRPRPALQTFRGATQSFTLSKEMSGAIKTVAREANATVYMTLLAGFSAFLGSWTGESDLAIGTSNGNRSRVELEDMLGFFVNTQVLRIDASGNPTFRELVGRVASVALEAYSHQDVPFERLVEELRLERDLSRSPLFDVLFVLQNTPLETEIREQAAGASARTSGLPLRALGGVPGFPSRTVASGSKSRVLTETGMSKFDMTLYVEEAASGFRGSIEYNTDLFDHDTVTRALDRFESLLEAAVRNPSRRVSDLVRLTAADSASLAEWNDTRRLVAARTLHGLVTAQCGRTPDQVAIRCGDERVTYRELEARSNGIAAALRDRGVGAGHIVGVYLNRSAGMVTALLGILKAGAAYLPLDPSFPGERLTFMVADAGASLIVSDAALVEDARGFGVAILDVSAEGTNAPAAVELPAVDGDDLAYILYTSGSTGRPKGVQVPHRAIVNFIESMAERPGLAPHDTLLAVTTLSFDIAALELFLPIATGATVVVASRQIAADPVELTRALRECGATVMQATPATWRMLVEAGWRGPDGFRALCGGEAMPRDLARDLIGRGVELWNLYGPTETTVWSTAERLTSADGPITIGRPIANTTVHILDGTGLPVPIGAIGEICIGGAGVARGYRGRPDLTADRFVPDASGRGARMYRTGDLGRWRTDGRLECFGRMDHQVKLRGFRIELGEIESILAEQPGVRQAVAHVHEARGGALLVAYVVLEAGAALQTQALRAAVAAMLPQYMHPSAFIALDEMPLTPNGKVDRKALPAPDGQAAAAREFVAPRGGFEESIAGIWCDVLRVDVVGAQDNFFELGGHSLLLVQVQARLSALLGRTVPVVELFQFPTIEALARHLGGGTTAVSLGSDAQARVAKRHTSDQEAIAVVGMAGRFPGASSIEAFWTGLRNGTEAIQFFSDDELRQAGVPDHVLANARYVRARGSLEGTELFDASFFKFTPREATWLDPQQRVFLECAWEALERAGYDPEAYAGLIGVFAGSSFNTYLPYALARMSAANLAATELLLTADKDHLATRVSYKLNLRGPAVSVQTACSTSLVAVHFACQSLLNQECDMALAGGVSAPAPAIGGHLFEEGGIMSPDGHCRPFDARANGTVAGAGVGLVVLKRLSDALADGDQIEAVIRGDGDQQRRLRQGRLYGAQRGRAGARDRAGSGGGALRARLDRLHRGARHGDGARRPNRDQSAGAGVRRGNGPAVVGARSDR